MAKYILQNKAFYTFPPFPTTFPTFLPPVVSLQAEGFEGEIPPMWGCGEGGWGASQGNRNFDSLNYSYFFGYPPLPPFPTLIHLPPLFIIPTMIKRGEGMWGQLRGKRGRNNLTLQNAMNR
jgi:hypothetical protein